MSATNDSSDVWSWAMSEPKLSAQETALRNVFVEEYLKDRNPVLAAIRCGFLEEFAPDWAKKLMGEPYVQKRIKDLQLAIPQDPKAEEERIKRIILQGLLDEAGNPKANSARVSALSRLAVMYGMDAPKKIEIDQKIRGGVMVVPGAIANVEDWEQAALASQQKLTHDVRH